MEIVENGVGMVGEGRAGPRTALAQADPTLRIALIPKGYCMRSHTCAA